MNTEEPRAVALVWTADEQAFGQPFEGPGCLDKAHAFADDLRERDDFPGALIAVTGNETAAQDRTDRLLWGLGIDTQTQEVS